MDDRMNGRQVAERLADLYDQKFGGKDRGRFRISMKHLRALAGRKRIPVGLVSKISEELFELGYVLVDLETYFIVMSQATFRSYRRVSDSYVSSMMTGIGHA
jgi:hypothetical protein